jgi:NAD(P)-dependent dehydrogenase (short-subunit alcohol dehydrogenase family)
MKLPKDRVVLITGASRGIGRALAEAFRKDGARVAAFARSEMPGLDAYAIRGDVRNPADLKRAINQVVERFGEIHVLVNCAGVGLYSKVEDLTRVALEDLFSTNVFGVVYAIQAALPHLKRSRGQIINISSVLARSTLPLSGAYSMTKHSIHALSIALRIELASSGVDVIEIGPGPTDTSFAESSTVLGLGEAPRFVGRVRPWAPQRVAEAILRASKHRNRELWLTFMGRALILSQRLFPGLTDSLLKKTLLDKHTERSGSSRAPDTWFSHDGGVPHEEEDTRSEGARQSKPTSSAIE